MATPSDLGDMNRQLTHPLDIGSELNGADDSPLFRGRSQCQQGERLIVRVASYGADVFAFDDDPFGRREICLQHRVRCPAHRSAGHSTRLRKLGCQSSKLLVTAGAHAPGFAGGG
jgi:hypothetical protein